MRHVIGSCLTKTDNFNKCDLERKVEKINICAYPNQSDPKYPTVNHWVLFLQCSPTSSVKVDMYHMGIGTLEISSKKYSHTDQAVHMFSLEPTREFTVDDFVNLVGTERLYRYDFTDEEYREGCRFWNYTVIECLEREGCLTEGTAEGAWDALSYAYDKPGQPILREIKRGTFY